MKTDMRGGGSCLPARIVVLALVLLTAETLRADVVNTTHAGSGPYTTIQAAVSDAATVNGDTLIVTGGPFAENVTVNKALFIFGSGNPAVSSFQLAATPITIRGCDVFTVATVDSTARIQDAIDAVTATGSVDVGPGTYFEHVVIEKAMNLIGNTGVLPTINGSGTGNCITVNSAYIRIKNVILTNAVNGLAGTTTNSQFRYFSCVNNSGSGVSLTNSDNNLIHSLHISGHTGLNGCGIELVSCRFNTLTGNELDSNTYNIRISGTVYRASMSNIVQANTLLDPGTWSLQISSGAATSHANFNAFNTTLGGDKFISNTTPAETLEAHYNWFQGHDGPGGVLHPTDFQGVVDSTNWFDNSPNTNIAIFPYGYKMSVGQYAYFSVMAFVPPSRQVRETRVTLSWNDTLLTMQDGEIPGAFFFNKIGPGQNETFSISPASPTNTITVIDSLNGGTSGAGPTGSVPYVSTLFIMKFRAEQDGFDSLKLSSIVVNDENWQPLPQVVNLSPGGVLIGGSVPSDLIVNTKVYLQGAYNGTDMDSTLRQNGYVPTSQPYNVAPWNYAGTENNSPVPNAVVDWVLVELRTGTAASTKFATRAGFLLADGSIKETPGASPLHFSGFDPGNYYIVVRHRNHLAIMSAAAVPISDNSALYDFTTGQAQAYGTNPMVQVGSAFCMIAGNGNGDGSINAVDRNSVWRVQNGSINGYYTGDFNLNGTVNAIDRNTYWRVNNGILSQVP
ncbi:MAG: hypothetical protein AB1428_07875 [Bacteroidota bacterium]